MGKEKKIKEVEQLISMEGEKGFMGFDEESEIPANDIVSSDQIDDVLMMFDEMDIDVVDDLQGLKVDEEKVPEKEDEEEEWEVDTLGRATDPVRMYLREMGSVALLTREGEVEIAKRIESGKREVLSVVLSCPMVVKEIINLGKAIKAGQVEIREVTNELDEEEASLEEELAQRKKIWDLIERIRRTDEGIRRLQKKKGRSRQKKVNEQVRKKQEEILNCFRQMNLRDTQIHKIVQKMKQMLARVDKAESEIQDHKLSKSVSSFLITAFQAYMYFEAQKDAKKFTLNVTLKSGLKRKGAENLMDYYYRLRKDLTIKAGKTFRRITYHRSEIMDYYKREVNNIIAEINRRRVHPDDIGLFYMNPSACSMIECEYQPICENLALPKGLYKIEGANNDKKQHGEQCAR